MMHVDGGNLEDTEEDKEGKIIYSWLSTHSSDCISLFCSLYIHLISCYLLST